MPSNQNTKWIVGGVIIVVLAFLGITCYSRSNNGTAAGTTGSSSSVAGQVLANPSGTKGPDVTSQGDNVTSSGDNVTSSTVPTVSSSK